MSVKAALALKTFALTTTWGTGVLVVWSAVHVLEWVATDGPVVGLLRAAAIIIPSGLWAAYWSVIAEELDCTEAFVASRRKH